MMKRRLSDAVPPMPENFMARVETTLKEISYMRSRRISQRYVAIALTGLLVIALTGIAFALSRSELLNRVFPSQTPPPEIEQAVQKDVASTTAEGITLSVTELLTDGASARINLSVSSGRDKPVYFFAKVDFDDNENIHKSATGVLSNWGMAMLGGESIHGQEFEGVVDAVYTGGKRPDDPVNMHITLYAFGSDYAPVMIQPGDAEDIYYLQESDPLLRELEANRTLGITPSGSLTVEKYTAYISALEAELANTEVIGWDDDAPERNALVSSGIFQPICTLELQTEISFEANSVIRETKPGQTEYDLPIGKLRINEIDFGIASTRIRYDIILPYPVKVPDEIWNWKDWLEETIGIKTSYVLVGPDGEILDEMLEIGSNTSQEPEGTDGETQYLRIESAGLPIAAVPEYVIFTPTNKVENEIGMPVHEWYQKLIADAKPEDCIKVIIESK